MLLSPFGWLIFQSRFLAFDTNNFKEASKTSAEVMELVMHMKNELKQRRTQPHLSLLNETLDGEELKD